MTDDERKAGGRMNIRRTWREWDQYAQDRGYSTLMLLLHQLYVKNGLTTRELGNDLGVSRDRANQLLRKVGIPLRKQGGVRC